MGTYWEKKSSRTRENGQTKSVTLLYGAKDYSDPSAAETAVLAVVGDTYEGLGLVSSSCEANEENEAVFDLVLQYGSPTGTIRPDNDEVIAFDTGGETNHILQSRSTKTKATRNDYASIPLPAPDYKGAINVTSQGIDGADVVAGALRISVTKEFDVADVDDAYFALLAQMTGTVNQYPFRGFASGEVLFLGASGQRRGNGTEPWEITFNFAMKRNRTGVVIPADGDLGDDLTIVVGDVEGWELVWLRFDEVEDTAGKAIVRRPVHAYVEVVYEKTAFGALGIDG